LTATSAELTEHADRSLLIVEDDKPFLERLSRAMETRGFRRSPWSICGSATATASTSCPR